MVYLSRSGGDCVDHEEETVDFSTNTIGVPNWDGKFPILEGRLHFAKFETSNINYCLDFIKSKMLHLGGMLTT